MWQPPHRPPSRATCFSPPPPLSPAAGSPYAAALTRPKTRTSRGLRVFPWEEAYYSRLVAHSLEAADAERADRATDVADVVTVAVAATLVAVEAALPSPRRSLAPLTFSKVAELEDPAATSIQNLRASVAAAEATLTRHPAGFWISGSDLVRGAAGGGGGEEGGDGASAGSPVQRIWRRCPSRVLTSYLLPILYPPFNFAPATVRAADGLVEAESALAAADVAAEERAAAAADAAADAPPGPLSPVRPLTAARAQRVAIPLLLSPTSRSPQVAVSGLGADPPPLPLYSHHLAFCSPLPVEANGATINVKETSGCQASA